MNSADDSTLDVARKFSGALGRLGIPHLVGGSVASTLHGEPRSTFDVDFSAHVRLEDVEKLCAALDDDFWVDRELVRDAVARGRHFNVIHRKPPLKVDVFVRPRSGHFALEITRAMEREPVMGLRLATAEDTLLRKLWWYRLGGEQSDRQWRDVSGLVKLRGSQGLDVAYMRQYAVELGVSDLLERLLAGA